LCLEGAGIAIIFTRLPAPVLIITRIGIWEYRSICPLLIAAIAPDPVPTPTMTHPVDWKPFLASICLTKLLVLEPGADTPISCLSVLGDL